MEDALTEIPDITVSVIPDLFQRRMKKDAWMQGKEIVTPLLIQQVVDVGRNFPSNCRGLIVAVLHHLITEEHPPVLLVPGGALQGALASLAQNQTQRSTLPFANQQPI